MAPHTMNELLMEGIQTHGEAPGDSSLNDYGEAVATGAEQHASCAPLGKPRIEPKFEDQRPAKASLTNALPAPKLRPALDVLNRIRYDPNLDDEDHIVGYRDRHDGVQELCAALWKSDTTDEEFIRSTESNTSTAKATIWWYGTDSCAWT
ncbi:duf455 domain-containing protein [Lasallia pustulata]|uniref:Duf455 domain-containing protein n=1 Tax=Lasallia pustulata TaxID=136370 RepID=A0A1W5CVE9_9LECA|nr:duf455 domain-containing protein [Lasallia pustulata]